jgi:hypothetical protein
MRTPFFPFLRPRLAARHPVSPSFSLPPDWSRLQTLLQSFFPAFLLSQSDEGQNSRERTWTTRLTFWTFLWQVLHPGNSCRQSVHHAFSQALKLLHKLPTVAAYCQARGRLPDDQLRRIDQQVIQAAKARCPADSPWHGWNLKVVDGSSSSMSDTPECQEKWPQPVGQGKGCGFPVVKWVGLFCLATGVLLAKAAGSLHSHELRLFQQLWEALSPGDLVVADRGFSSYAMYALFQLQGLAAVFRLQTGRKIAHPKRSRWKKIQRLGEDDHLIQWKKPYAKPAWMTLQAWEALPASINLRLISFRAQTRGFRDQSFTVATTLLDPEKYPAQELIDLYARRWKVEGLIRQLKTVMKMEILRCQSPLLIEKEMIMHRIAYNLIHCLILESALCQEVEVMLISYAGALSALQAFTCGERCSKRSQAGIYQELMEAIAREKLPQRPGRQEPRALKRRPKPYPLLNKPRHLFKEIPHRNRSRKIEDPQKIEALS